MNDTEPTVREDKSVAAASLVAAIIGTVWFLFPHPHWVTRLAVLLLAIAISVSFFASPGRRVRRIGQVASIAIVSAWVVWILASRPTAHERYVDRYLQETESANIWTGRVAMNPGARKYMLDHYAAFDPTTVHYEYDLSGAVPRELENFVEHAGQGQVGGPVVLLGEVAAFSRGRDFNESMVQLLPLSNSQVKEWRARGIGGLAVIDSRGTLNELYPTHGYDGETPAVSVYARVHLRPLDKPHEGAPMVVRGLPIAYGRVPVKSGRSFDTIYIAGSSGRVNE